jgi:hypothetical protein
MTEQQSQTLARTIGISFGLIGISAVAHMLLQPHSEFWNINDTILGFATIRELRIGAAVSELFLAFALFRSNRHALGAAIYSSIVISYKISFLLADSRLPCSCLGLLRSWFHISDATESIVALLIAVSWFVASLCIALSHKRSSASFQ